MISTRSSKFDHDTFAEIIGHSADAILSVDTDNNIVLFNVAAEKLFGYSHKEIIGQPLEILLPRNIRPIHDDLVEEFETSGNKTRYMGERTSVTGLTKDERAVFLEISIQKHPKGSPFRYTAICRNISARLEIQRKVKENEEKFRALFDASNQFVIILDTQGTILDLNKTALNSLKDKADKYIGGNLGNCDFWLTDLDRSIIQKAILNIKTTNISHQMVSISNKFNVEIIFELTMKNLSRVTELSDFVILEGLDITERVRANRLLALSEDRLSRAQKIARIGNWEWKISSNELIWSDEVFNIFGIKKKDFGLNYDAFLDYVHPNDRAAVEEAMKQALNNDIPYVITHRIISPDGSEKVVREIGEILRIEDGSPLRMDGTVQDITDEWTKTHGLIEAKSKAEEENFAKSQFLATISHELRDHLNAIIGFSTLIKDQALGPIGQPAYQGYGEDIKNSGDHLLTLIDEILDVSKIDMGSIKAHNEYFDITKFIDECLKTITATSNEKNIDIKIDVSKNMRAIFLDESLCKQILTNLLTNSIKYTPNDGQIIIKAAINDQEIELSVTDTGIGMSEDEVKYILDPYDHVASANLRTSHGVGIGLTIVKNLTEAQGGRFSVTSEKDKGSTFTVHFPIIESD